MAIAHSISGVPVHGRISGHEPPYPLQGAIPDTILCMEHQPVYSLGKRGVAEHFKVPQTEVCPSSTQLVRLVKPLLNNVLRIHQTQLQK